jgi:hypothetical protein
MKLIKRRGEPVSPGNDPRYQKPMTKKQDQRPRYMIHDLGFIYDTRYKNPNDQETKNNQDTKTKKPKDQ